MNRTPAVTRTYSSAIHPKKPRLREATSNPPVFHRDRKTKTYSDAAQRGGYIPPWPDAGRE